MPVARLLSAKSVPFVEEIIASGASKDVYFTEDRKSVVEFYRNSGPQTKIYRERLKAILTAYNLAAPRSCGGIASDEAEAERMRKIFCWPTGVTVAPRLGFVAPVFPERFWFKHDPRNLPAKDAEWGKVEKKAAWFTARRIWKTLARRERGDLRSMMQVCILLAHGVGRLHLCGLAHSDLSSNNILVDPIPSSEDGWPGCMIIDLDTLVVPGFFPPAVIGTRGYIAPEVLATSRLEKAKMPDKTTDRHALSVLLYELLLNRHPLDGPKMRSAESQEEDEFLAFGQDALFVEHPSDESNRPKHLGIGYQQLGPELSRLVTQAFVTGLHDPEARPLASEWEGSLWKSVDLLYPCTNSTCLWRWFVCDDRQRPTCPYCHSPQSAEIAVLKFLSPRGGQDTGTGELICWSGQSLQPWHAGENIGRLPWATQPVADISRDAAANHWSIRNIGSLGMSLVSPQQKTIPMGGRQILSNGMILRLGGESNGRFAKFTIEHE